MSVFTRRVATLAACVVAFCSSLGGIARADVVDVLSQPPEMYFTFTHTATTETVCGVGILRTPPAPNPTWTLTLLGFDSIGTLIDIEGSSFAQNGSVCRTVTKFGSYGTYFAVYRYVAPLDPPSAIFGHVLWTPSSDSMTATAQ